MSTPPEKMICTKCGKKHKFQKMTTNKKGEWICPTCDNK